MKPNELITSNKTNIGPGIYMILCISNNKAYIGQTSSIKRRWTEHKKLLRAGRHDNEYLQNCWNKYGKDSFVFNTLENIEPNEQLEEKYVQMIDEDLRLNLRGFTPATRHSDETRAKISKANKGKMPAKHTLEAAWAANRGRKLTDEHKAQIVKSHKGRICSQETKDKIGLANKDRKPTQSCIDAVRKANLGNKNMLGHVHSEDTRKKMSDSRKGKIPWNKGIKKIVP